MGRRKCIITLKMYLNTTCILVMKEELYMYIQSHACIVGTYTAPVPCKCTGQH